jgi:magnesium chelatase family protein
MVSVFKFYLFLEKRCPHMLTKVFGSAVFGVEATTITVEVNIDKGVGYHLVGLPDNAIKESSYRIAAALKNNGYSLPGKKITINMAPADLRKEGSAYDLTLAIGILAASGQIRADEVDQYLIMGELSLDGGLQPIKGALSIAIKAKEDGFKGFFLPIQNVKEAAIVQGLDVYGIENVLQIIDFFEGNVVKYVTRWKHKNGIQDLEKAKMYLDKYIEIQKDKLKENL